VREQLGGKILGEHGVAGGQRAGADAAELVHGDAAANECLITDLDVTAEHAAVGQDDAVADLAVVGDVRPGHEQATRAEARRPARGRGPMHGDMLAEHRAFPNLDQRFRRRVEA
jgi:hypothetical protein